MMLNNFNYSSCTFIVMATTHHVKIQAIRMFFVLVCSIPKLKVRQKQQLGKRRNLTCEINSNAI